MGNYDAVHKPAHYTEGRKFEPKDVIRDWGLNFNLGSSLKYIARAGRKDDIVQDLSKAKEYIQFEIDAILAERAENDDAVDAIHLCATCIHGSIEKCWKECVVGCYDLEADDDGNIISCTKHRNEEDKHPNCKCSVEPIFVESEDGEGFSVMHVRAPEGASLEDILKIVTEIIEADEDEDK